MAVKATRYNGMPPTSSVDSKNVARGRPEELRMAELGYKLGCTQLEKQRAMNHGLPQQELIQTGS